MSDQPLATQKPKPGSLRDRIAAFEKSATAGAAPINPPPPPRPKPAGFATWKPKHTSPPSSPPATQTEHAGPSSSMSASDARDSITKGASLKERMAALQNKGAFGAPPPVGPKPAVEKPKWKPPPIVPSDEGDGPKEAMPVVEKTLSPPIRYERTLGDSVQGEGEPTHGGTAEAVNEDTETTQDPEDEDRQRRAAIAARMARLGGARVGMAPPIIGKKPLRRPTQEEDQRTVENAKPAESPSLEPTSSEEQGSYSNVPTTVSSEPETQKPAIPQSRKNSMNTTVETDSGHSPKVPASMPVPVVPRRTGPPRKKPSKPSAPLPEPPKEEPTAAVVDVDVAGSSQVVHEEPGPTSSTSIDLTSEVASPTIEHDLSPPTRDLELASSALHDDPEELEKSDVVAESSSSPPEAHLRMQDSDPSREVEAVDEVLPPSATSPAQIISEPTGGEIEREEFEDVVSDKRLITEDLGDLASDSAYTPEEVYLEPSESLQEEILNEEINDQSEVNPRLDEPNDQNTPSPPPIVPTLPSTSLTRDTAESIDGSTSPGRRRSVPPPRRIVPSVPEGNLDRELVEEPESDEEAGEDLAQSHLFIPPPREKNAEHRNIQEDDVGGDSDGSEYDAPALPVPHRHSTDMRARSIMPSMHSDSSSEPDTDHDGEALPVPPRPAPLIHRPSRPQETLQSEDEEPRNLPISILTPFPLDREIMDEDEGDPIDPDFHIPSRRSSYLNLARGAASPSIHPPHSPPPPIPGSRPQNTLRPQQYIPFPPGQANQPEGTIEFEEDESRKQTIAERMARLGGIKFGAAPIPRPTSSAVQEGERLEISNNAEDNSDLPGSEEEEERARKERISARLAGMGGMRIGMMPIGTGNAPTKGSQLREEPAPSSPPNPVAPARPSRVAPRPPEQTPGAEPDTGSSNTSDDGVQVEAEESEAEEVDYQDAEPEEEAPPIPSRSGRATRRESSGDTAVSPPPPARRPPIPATPPRRLSGQVPSPLTTPPQRKDSSHVPQYDYVMVDQIEGEETLPTRRASGFSARPAPEMSKSVESQENISSQWELPSIPTSSLNFGASADLSLSWSDAGELLSPPQPTQTSLRGKVRRQPTTDMSISADDLITIWGRVGVQVCEVATALFEKSKKTLIGDGTYSGFIKAVLADVPNSAEVSIDAGEYGYLVYSQNGSVVQKRASEIMPGDIVEVHDARFKGHKGLQTYQLSVGASGELVMGIVAEFDTKKSKIKAFQANQHVGQQTVESVSYRLDDLKSGTIKIYRVLEAA